MIFAPRSIGFKVCRSNLSRTRGFTALVFLAGVCLPAAAQTATNPAAVNFGSEAVGTALAQTAVTFAVTASGTMGTPLVLTTGLPNLDYTLGTGSTCTGSVSSGTCTVNVVFDPLAPGVRMGAVELTNSTGTVIATALIYGNGVGPQVTFAPALLSTVAGSGTTCSSVTATCGDGGPATAASAQMNGPSGVAVDGAGNVYIADQADNRIRKVSAATGEISTVAGTGTACSSSTATCGDGGSATASGAELNFPMVVALDGAGNLYISDILDYRIRKVTAATGYISTVAGTGTACPIPTQACGDGGLATASGAYLSAPYGVAVDGAGNLYIADTGDERIRKVSAATGIISTVAGTGAYCGDQSTGCGDGGPATASGVSLGVPQGVAVDGAGNLYIADTGDERIRKVSVTTGYISDVAGTGGTCVSGNSACLGDGGPATKALFYNPTAVALDGAGNVYIVDSGDNRIRMVTAATGIVTTVAGSAATCSVSTAACGDGGSATAPAAAFYAPQGVALDGAGNLYIAGNGDNRIRKVSAAALGLSFATTAAGATSSDSPQTVQVSNIGNAALTFTNPTGGGNNPSVPAGYTLGNTMTCPQLTQNSSAGTLASGLSCTALVSFTPVASGADSGNLIFTDNSLYGNAVTQLVPLNGTGTADAFTVTGVSPASGPTAGGTTVVITGTGFSAATSVKFGTLPASFSIVGTTQINAVSPAETAGTVDVIVGSATDVSVAATADQFTYAGVPTVTAISPASGSIKGGTVVTITGTNLTNASQVTFGGTVGTMLSVLSANTITVLTPAKAAGAVAVVVYAAGGSVSVSSGYTFLPPLVFVAGSGKLESFASDGSETSAGTVYGGVGAAVDSSGYVWSIVNTGTSVSRFNSLGAGVNEYNNDGLVGASALAIDGNSQIWVTNSSGLITLLSNAGAVVATTQGSTTAAPSSLTIDLSGDVWIANPGANTVDEIIGGAGPAAPLSTAVTSGTPGARP